MNGLSTSDERRGQICVGRVVDARFELDPRWSETGDRYILKLFRDFVFHSTGVDGAPILDLSHVLTCLNKVSCAWHTSTASPPSQVMN
jgi:hypothetical protein